MRGELRPKPGARRSVRDELAEIAERSSGTDEFVHGLFSFLAELAARQPDHPIIATLTADMGRASAEAVAAGLLHDVASQLLVVGMHLDLMQADLQGVFDPGYLDAGQRLQMFTRFLDSLGAARHAAADAAQISKSGVGMHAKRQTTSEIVEVLDTVLEFGRRMVAKRIEITLEAKVGGSVYAPRPELLRVLFNLIRNAADAVAPELGPMVMLSAWQSDENVFVRVADNGPGIAAPDLEHIFELFFTTKGHGSGVGLFACRMLVEGWGGRLQVDSQRGQGARFTFSVPRVPQAGSGPEGG